ncbi:stage V sporulation protein D (sporulation-specific penicillin-binding protein) [Ruminococcus sp. YRD2003]|uniref:penicillin-binding transpeptidase domain-containing protein n=1 Tax=Ruminococcus sp. YRD2003 TaxID=1452313 RepID=UPI0008C1CC0C|nr:stage V sporulation protein D (sporulation-specific penicillin-binding protein) [Ruminococcus flavefaciens]
MANKNLPSRSMKLRTRFIMTSVFFGLFAVVAGNFFNISVLNNKKYQAMANDQHFGSIIIPAHRGSIYDAKATPLAKSASVYKVFLDPKRFREDLESLGKRIDKQKADIASGNFQPKIETTTNENGEEAQVVVTNTLPESAEAFRAEAVELLSSKLGIQPEKVSAAMEENTQYHVLQEQVEKPVADELLKFFSDYGMTCLNVEEDTKRYYPQNELAASVIGFTHADGYGIYGIEASYDDYLAGTDGRTISAKDSNGNELPYRYSKTYPAKNGNDVYLTIDMEIQYILEDCLQDLVTEFEVKNRACAILMNAKTGAVYGMATYPSFDLNQPREIVDHSPIITNQKLTPEETESAMLERQWRNKCISEIYEPGSVFKVVTSASAFEENLIDYDHDSFMCTGSVQLQGALNAIKCHQEGGHGPQDFQTALTNSCNPAFMEIGRRLGVEKFCYYFNAFGLDSKTGIDLPYEVSGKGFDPSTMSNVDLAVCSFGQGETITPMEMITSYCAAINGGYLLQPYVVDRVLDEDGNIVFKNERTVKRQVISEETSARMRDCLEKVVSGSGGGNVTIKGYSIGGKSGTSQRLMYTAQGITMNKDQEEDASIQEYGASYCCFTPADDPEIILLVLADMPNKDIGYYGSKVAVPTARNILTRVLPYMGISPEYSTEELANLDVKIPLLEGPLEDAINTLSGYDIQYKVIGEGSSVVAQSPVTGSVVAKGGTVYLYTESNHTVDYTEVPDLVGLDPSMANDSIMYCQLNYVARGASVNHAGVAVTKQKPEAGSKVAVGTTVELEFMVYSGGD